METLHRLAGVQDTDLDASDQPQPSQPVHAAVRGEEEDINTSFPNTPTAASFGGASQRASRASLPLGRKASHRSLRTVSRRASIEAPPIPNDAPPTPSLPFTTTFLPPQPTTAHLRSISRSLPPLPTGISATTATTVSAHPRVPTDGAHPDGDGDGDADGDDFVWGPTHPCFPHPNPHVGPDTPAARDTRVIRVRRDYLAAGDQYPAFANVYPEILEPLVDDAEFRMLVARLNVLCKAAFAPRTPRAWWDSLVGAATGYLSDDLGWTGAKKGEREIEILVQRWNAEREREGKDVRVMPLRRTGYMNLDFVVPDPGLDEVE